MAKKMVDEIKNAEVEGQQIIEKARLSAKELLVDAQSKAKELLEAAKKQTIKDSDKIISDAEAAADSIKAEAERLSWSEGEKISKKADKKRTEAVKKAITVITG